MDYPYEQCGVFLDKWNVYVHPIGGEVTEIIFASYKSREAAEDALHKMRANKAAESKSGHLKFFRFPEDDGRSRKTETEKQKQEKKSNGKI